MAFVIDFLIHNSSDKNLKIFTPSYIKTINKKNIKQYGGNNNIIDELLNNYENEYNMMIKYLQKSMIFPGK